MADGITDRICNCLSSSYHWALGYLFGAKRSVGIIGLNNDALYLGDFKGTGQGIIETGRVVSDPVPYGTLQKESVQYR